MSITLCPGSSRCAGGRQGLSSVSSEAGVLHPLPRCAQEASTGLMGLGQGPLEMLGGPRPHSGEGPPSARSPALWSTPSSPWSLLPPSQTRDTNAVFDRHARSKGPRAAGWDCHMSGPQEATGGQEGKTLRPTRHALLLEHVYMLMIRRASHSSSHYLNRPVTRAGVDWQDATVQHTEPHSVSWDQL